VEYRQSGGRRLLPAAELATQVAQLLLLDRGESTHELSDRCRVFGKDLANERFTLGRQYDDELAFIFRTLLAMRKAQFLKVADDHREVASRGQDLLRDVGKRHGAEMIQSFHDGKLSESEASASEVAGRMVADGVGGAGETDVGRQGEALRGFVRHGQVSILRC
jgi:hypothetical protein